MMYCKNGRSLVMLSPWLRLRCLSSRLPSLLSLLPPSLRSFVTSFLPRAQPVTRALPDMPSISSAIPLMPTAQHASPYSPFAFVFNLTFEPHLHNDVLYTTAVKAG